VATRIGVRFSDKNSKRASRISFWNKALPFEHSDFNCGRRATPKIK
jgi:hypothetical protein